LSVLRNIYFAFVYPHILYGIEVYANTNNKEINACKIYSPSGKFAERAKICKADVDHYLVLDNYVV